MTFEVIFHSMKNLHLHNVVILEKFLKDTKHTKTDAFERLRLPYVTFIDLTLINRSYFIL